MELLVVIAIIATLTGLLVPTVGMLMNKGPELRTESAINAMSGSISEYYMSQQEYPDSSKF